MLIGRTRLSRLTFLAYNGSEDDRVQSEIDALTKLYQDGILTEEEYETKREIIMNLCH